VAESRLSTVSPPEAARELGIPLCEVYREIWNHKLPAFRVSKRWRIPKAVIEQRLQRDQMDAGFTAIPKKQVSE